MIGLLVLCIGTIIWANLWKNDMRVTDIRVNGNLILTDKDVLSLADIKKEQRLFNVDLLAVQNRVVQNAFVKSASVNREVPNRISISVNERVPLAVVALDKMCYLDTDGIVLPPARSENIFDLPVLTGSLDPANFRLGKEITDPDVREALGILSTAKQLDDGLYRRISEIHIEHGKDIVVYTAEYGIPVIFGHGDIGMKLVKLDGFWKEIVYHRGANDLDYIDLRFADQVVVRWNKDNERMRASRNGFEKLQTTKTS